jgi:hypothetical protein
MLELINLHALFLIIQCTKIPRGNHMGGTTQLNIKSYRGKRGMVWKGEKAANEALSSLPIV